MRITSIPQRLLNKFLGTDVRYLAIGSFWLSLNKAVNIGVALLLSVLYARYLSKDTYGSYRYILSFVGIFGICAIPGMGTAVIRSMARGMLGSFRTASGTIFLFSFGISFACALTALYFFYTGNMPLAAGFFSASILVPLSEGLGAWRTYYTATRLFHKGTTLSSVVQLAYGAGMIGMVAVIVSFHLSMHATIALLTATYLAMHAIPNIILTRRILRSIPPDAPRDPSMLSYGFRLSAAEIPSTIATYLDSVVLYTFLGPAALAVYSFATAPVEQIKSIFGTTATVSMPKLAEKTATAETTTALKKTLPPKLIRACLFTTGAVAVYILLAPFLFQLLFPAYSEAVPYTQVFALSLALFPLGVFGTALKAEGDMKKIYIFSIGDPLIQIAAIAVLVPLYGIGGAIAARVGGRIFHQLLLTYLYIKK